MGFFDTINRAVKRASRDIQKKVLKPIGKEMRKTPAGKRIVNEVNKALSVKNINAKMKKIGKKLDNDTPFVKPAAAGKEAFGAIRKADARLKFL